MTDDSGLPVSRRRLVIGGTVSVAAVVAGIGVLTGGDDSPDGGTVGPNDAADTPTATDVGYGGTLTTTQAPTATTSVGSTDTQAGTGGGSTTQTQPPSTSTTSGGGGSTTQTQSTTPTSTGSTNDDFGEVGYGEGPYGGTT